MFGKNPKRALVNTDGSILSVQSIFATIQGEGPNTGKASVFIRLGGCNIACDFCDTEFEDFRDLSVEKILEDTKALSISNKGIRTKHLVVITGGEPFRQNIAYLCERLLEENFRVQIETNGTIYRPIPENVEIICSPKNIGNGYNTIREDLLSRISALKFIISASDSKYGDVSEVGQSRYNIPVYIQPMDEYNAEKNKENIELVKKLALENDYIISLQTHKILGID